MSNRNSRQKFEIWILLIYLVAFDTFGGKFVFITLGTINVMFFGDEGFCANWIVTCATNETFFVPLSSLVFHFLHSCKKEIVKMFIFLKSIFIYFVHFPSILLIILTESWKNNLIKVSFEVIVLFRKNWGHFTK